MKKSSNWPLITVLIITVIIGLSPMIIAELPNKIIYLLTRDGGVSGGSNATSLGGTNVIYTTDASVNDVLFFDGTNWNVGPVTASSTNATFGAKTNGTTVTASASILNFIYGSNVVIRTTNAAGQVDIQISATGGGGSSSTNDVVSAHGNISVTNDAFFGVSQQWQMGEDSGFFSLYNVSSGAGAFLVEEATDAVTIGDINLPTPSVTVPVLLVSASNNILGHLNVGGISVTNKIIFDDTQKYQLFADAFGFSIYNNSSGGNAFFIDDGTDSIIVGSSIFTPDVTVPTLLLTASNNILGHLNVGSIVSTNAILASGSLTVTGRQTNDSDIYAFWITSERITNNGAMRVGGDLTVIDNIRGDVLESLDLASDYDINTNNIPGGIASRHIVTNIVNAIGTSNPNVITNTQAGASLTTLTLNGLTTNNGSFRITGDLFVGDNIASDIIESTDFASSYNVDTNNIPGGLVSRHIATNIINAIAGAANPNVITNTQAGAALTTLTLTGPTTNSGHLRVDGAMNVTGKATNDSDLFVTGFLTTTRITNNGPARITGDLFVGDNLDVDVIESTDFASVYNVDTNNIPGGIASRHIVTNIVNAIGGSGNTNFVVTTTDTAFITNLNIVGSSPGKINMLNSDETGALSMQMSEVPVGTNRIHWSLDINTVAATQVLKIHSITNTTSGTDLVVTNDTDSTGSASAVGGTAAIQYADGTSFSGTNSATGQFTYSGGNVFLRAVGISHRLEIGSMTELNKIMIYPNFIQAPSNDLQLLSISGGWRVTTNGHLEPNYGTNNIGSHAYPVKRVYANEISMTNSSGTYLYAVNTNGPTGIASREHVTNIVNAISSSYTPLLSTNVTAVSTNFHVNADVAPANDTTFEIDLAANSGVTIGGGDHRQIITIAFLQDTDGEKTVALTNLFAFGLDLPSPLTLSTNGGVEDITRWMYHSSSNKWYHLGAVRGF